MQIERLVQMVFYIINHGHVTARELSDYFNVSTRTIYRDINILACRESEESGCRWEDRIMRAVQRLSGGCRYGGL